MASPFLRKPVFYWSLYDFAASFAVAVFGIYFAQWLVVDHHLSDFKFNMIFVGSSFFLVLTAPVFGVIVDKVRVKLPSLRLITAYSFASLFALSLIAMLAPPTKLVVNVVVAILLAGQYFYQLAYVCYNPLLKELGTEQEQAEISGIGQAASGLGQILGLFLTLPLATGVIYLFGHRDESQVFLPTALLFLILSLPMLLLYKERTHEPVKLDIDVFQEFRRIGQNFRSLGRIPGIQRFLLAYFFFNDAVLTAAHNFPIYIQQVFAVSQFEKTAILGAILISAALGALLAGFIANYTGEKKLLVNLLAAWVVVLPLTALQTELAPFTVCLVVVGLLVGATAAVARAVLTYLTPAAELTHAFSYYAMSERLSTFFGPVVWGLVTTFLLPIGPLRYQVALATMGVFVLLGFLIVRSIPESGHRAD